MQDKSNSEREIGKQLLAETSNYAESALCRRKLLLHYFGEEYREENCGNCDNCTMSKKKLNASEWLQSLIETVLALKEKFKAEYVVDVLRGVDTADTEAYGHTELEGL